MTSSEPADQPTDPSIAERLALLCWDANRGKVTSACGQGILHGIGGALLVDALLAGLLEIDDDRVTATGRTTADPLLGSVVAEIQDARKPPKIDKLVSSLASTDSLDAVRDRLLEQGLLEVVEDRVLGIFPRTRHPAVDPAPIEAVRAAVRDLLTGADDPEQAEPANVMVAAFTEPIGAVPLLIEDRSERKAATERAEAFANGHGIPTAVAHVAAEAQAALIAAASAAAVAATAASASSSSSASC